MQLTPIDPIGVEKLKHEARTLKRQNGMTHTAALEHVARAHKYPTWRHVIQSLTPITNGQSLIEMAIRNRATYIHMEMRGPETRVRFRVGDDLTLAATLSEPQAKALEKDILGMTDRHDVTAMTVINGKDIVLRL